MDFLISIIIIGTKYRDHQSSSLSLLFIVPVISVIILMLSALIVILAVVMKKIIIAKGLSIIDVQISIIFLMIGVIIIIYLNKNIFSIKVLQYSFYYCI